MGSLNQTLVEAVDYLNGKGEKVGMVAVHLFRPFSVKHFLNAIPSTVTKIAVMDRTKEPGALGEPVYQDVRTAFYGTDRNPIIVGGRYGLGGKDVNPDQVLGIYEELKKDVPANGFTIGIDDDLNGTSLALYPEDVDLTPAGTTACKFWGLAVLLAPTSPLSRSSATRPSSMLRLISLMTPRSPAVSPCPI